MNNSVDIRTAVIAAGVCLAMGWALETHAVTRTATTSGNWSDTGVWSGTVPQTGDDAVINAGVVVTQDVASADLDSLTVNTGGTSMFTGWDNAITATVVTVDGTISHAPNSDTSASWIPDARVYLVCSNLSVNAGGTIHADSAGYGPAPASSDGFGPGGGTYGSVRGGGGGYGGEGGQGRLDPTSFGGTPYGSAAAPGDPGSGGGAKTGQANTTGWGGGAIRIDATGLVTVDGTIRANGGPGTSDSGGGGSGGGIYISCSRVTGDGTIAADGGSPPAWGGPGGGGRIALVYNVAQQALQNQTDAPGLLISANHKVNTGGDVTKGRPGTVYLTDNSFLSSLHLQSMWIRGATSWAPDHLNVTNKWLIFADGFVLGVTNDVLVSAGGALEITNVTLTAGSLTVSNSSEMVVFAGETIAAAPAWGALIDVDGALNVANGCTLFVRAHSTNGVSPLFRAGSVDIATGGLIDGDFAGFWNDLGPGAGQYGSGAGYGGVGGDAAWQQSGWPAPPYSGGGTYGDSNAPALPGSGGGARVGHSVPGGALVRIEADNGLVNVDGTITVTGQSNSDRSGGGSGGAIYITCDDFTGGGVMRANGGSTPNHSGGGGGGGRIAIAYYGSTNYTGTATADFGTGSENDGIAGTVVWRFIPPPPPAGTVILVK